MCAHVYVCARARLCMRTRVCACVHASSPRLCVSVRRKTEIERRRKLKKKGGGEQREPDRERV